MIGFRVALLALALVWGAPASSQSSEDLNMWPQCRGVFALCGYATRKSNEWLIEPIYEGAGGFSEGLAPVRIDGKWGFIDPQGTVVIAPMFRAVGLYRDGMAEAIFGDGAGVIDRSGALILDPVHQSVLPFTKDVFFASEGTLSSWRAKGAPTLSRPLGRSLRLIDRQGRRVTEDTYEVKAVVDGRARVVQRTGIGPELIGMLRPDGSWQISPGFSLIGQTRQGLTIVRAPMDHTVAHPMSERQVDPAGVIDADGAFVLEPEFPSLSFLSDRFYLAESIEGQAVVRLDGSLVGDRYFDAVDMTDAPNMRVKNAGSWFLLQEDGSLVPAAPLVRKIKTCEGGLSFADVDGLIQISHPTLAKPIQTEQRYLGTRTAELCLGPYSFRVDDNWGIIRQDGRIIGIFESVYRFRNSVTGVKVDGLWGLIDIEGRFVVKPRYNELMRVDEDIYEVKWGVLTFYIDSKGNRASKPPASDKARRTFLNCRGEAELFTENGLWGMRMKNGDQIIAPKYRALLCYVQGVAWGANDDGWCQIDRNGRLMQDRPCEEAKYSFIVSHHSAERLHQDRFESSVIWTRQLYDYARGARADAPYIIGDGVQGHGRKSISEYMRFLQ